MQPDKRSRMNGIVFTEFMEMVEARYGFLTADKIIVWSELPSKGIYTTVNSYASEELIKLVNELSTETDTPAYELLDNFGLYLFKRLRTLHPNTSANTNHTLALFSFLFRCFSDDFSKEESLLEVEQLTGSQWLLHFYCNNELKPFVLSFIRNCCSLSSFPLEISDTIQNVSGAFTLLLTTTQAAPVYEGNRSTETYS